MAPRLKKFSQLRLDIHSFRTLDERLEYFKRIRKEISQRMTSRNLCVTRRVYKYGVLYYLMEPRKTIPTFMIIHRLGSFDTLSGETYSACYPLVKTEFGAYVCGSKDHSQIAIKLIPLTKADALASNVNHYRLAWKEIYILLQCTKLVTNGIGFNLPIMYGYFLCDKMSVEKYNNKNIIAQFKENEKLDALRDRLVAIAKDIDDLSSNMGYYKDRLAQLVDRQIQYLDESESLKITNKCIVALNELANFDLSVYLRSINTKTDEFIVDLITFIYHILIGLRTINKHLKCIHMDLHLANILVHRIDDSGWYYYKIDGYDAYILYKQYLVKIWDFGRSVILDRDTPEEIVEASHSPYILMGLSGKQREPYIHAIEKLVRSKRHLELLYSLDTAVIMGILVGFLEAIRPTCPQKVKKNLDRFVGLIRPLYRAAYNDVTKGVLNPTKYGKPKGSAKEMLKRLTLKTKKKIMQEPINNVPVIV